jgi:hypothetical protein
MVLRIAQKMKEEKFLMSLDYDEIKVVRSELFADMDDVGTESNKVSDCGCGAGRGGGGKEEEVVMGQVKEKKEKQEQEKKKEQEREQALEGAEEWLITSWRSIDYDDRRRE